VVRQFDLDDIGPSRLNTAIVASENACDFGVEVVDIEGCGHADGEALIDPVVAAA